MIFIFVFFFMLSLILEVFSIYTLFYIDNFYTGMFVFFTSYFFAVLFLSVSLYPLIKSKTKAVFKSFFMIFLLAFLIPIFGYIFSLIFTAIYVFFIKEKPLIKTENVPANELLSEEVNLKRISYGEAFLKKAIESQDKNIPMKEEAIFILSSLKSPSSINLLKSAVYSDFDEVRLLALSFITGLEKDLNKKISSLLDKLEKTKDAVLSGRILKELAFLYWEFVYLNLVDKEFYTFYLNQSLKYAKEALEILGEDDKLYFLIGRIYLKLENLEKAEDFLKRSVFLNPINKNVYLYLAEVEFKKKNFSKVKELLENIKDIEKDYLSYCIVSVWRR